MYAQCMFNPAVHFSLDVRLAYIYKMKTRMRVKGAVAKVGIEREMGCRAIHSDGQRHKTQIKRQKPCEVQ